MRIQLSATLVLVAAGAAAAETPVTADQLVARHLESLGWRDPQAAQGLRVAEGSCRFEIKRGGAGALEGRARISSEGRRYRVELPFERTDYFGEKFAFDGHKVEVGFIQPGRRSPLGDFVNTYDVLVREGLLGGVLSAAWPLHDVAGRGSKLKYEGVKTVDAHALHQLAYKAQKGQGDVRVLLFFDPETFRHVRTQYFLLLRPSMGGAIDKSASQQDTRFEITEEFAEFETSAGLTLPRRWTLTFHMDGPSTNALWTWENHIEKVATAGNAAAN